MKIAHGTFGWCSSERRSDRYGAFYLSADAYSEPGVSVPSFDADAADFLRGKRVRLTAKVVESRNSGHAGDQFLKIEPSRPDVGEEIDLGVGIFAIGVLDFTKHPSIVLMPGDGRATLWLDPHKLYRLHDQTVDIYAEESDADFSPPPNVFQAEAGIVSLGDGNVQAKKVAGPVIAHAEVQSIGGGAFVVTQPGHGPFGSRVEYESTSDGMVRKYRRPQ